MYTLLASMYIRLIDIKNIYDTKQKSYKEKSLFDSGRVFFS